MHSPSGAVKRKAWTAPTSAPPAEIAAGAHTGEYRTTGNQLLVDDEGRSFISREDYAVAVLDELQQPKHIGQRLSVAY